jgi:RHS repeat-associated protein
MLRAQSVEAQSYANAIRITLSGSSAVWGAGIGSGKVQINPLPAGSYTVTFYEIRDGQSPVALISQTITLAQPVGGSPTPTPPSPPSPTPTSAPGSPPLGYDFAPTQSVGEIPFSYSVSVDGAASVTIPIAVPPGRQGIQPKLALVYSSRDGNGPVGTGWRLSGSSSITTCRQSPAVDGSYGGQYPDRFCLDGQRLVPAVLGLNGERWPTESGTYYLTETNPYSKIIAHGPTDYPDWFEVFTPDGMIYRYASRVASNAHSRIEGNVVSCVWIKDIPLGYAPVGPTPSPLPTCYADEYIHADVFGGCTPGALQRRVWLLDEVSDRFNNRMEIDYDFQEPLLPVEIRYTYHLKPPTRPIYDAQNLPLASTKKILFEYEQRTDIRQFSMDGIDYTAAKRLKTIKVFGPLGLSHLNYAWDSGILRQYELTYTPNPVTLQSTLTQLTERAGDQSDSPTKAPLNFSYTGSSIAFEDKAFPFVPANNLAGLYTFGLDGFRIADINGDGLDDLLYRDSRQNVLAPSWYYRLSDGQVFEEELKTNIPATPDTGGFTTGFVDLDRNETVDAMIPSLSGLNSNYTIGKGNKDGTFKFNTLPSTTYTLPGDLLDSFDRIVAIADLDGDGLPDLAIETGNAHLGTRRWAFARNQSDQSGIHFSDPFDFVTSGSACTPSGGPFSNCPNTGFDQNPAFVVDIDGNGVNELIVPRMARDCSEGLAEPRPGGYSLELVALGMFSPIERRTGLSSEATPLLFLDVNGDGLADAVRVIGQDSYGNTRPDHKLIVQMNEGGSYGPPQDVSVSSAALSALRKTNEARIGDFNNDGLEDIYLVSAGILLLSDGHLGFVETSLSFPVGDDTCQAAPLPCPDYARRGWDQTLDFNGDGLIDFVQVRGGNTHVLQRIGPAPALLQQITGGPLTPEVRFTYKSTPEVHTPDTSAFPQNSLHKGMWLVSELGVKANTPGSTYPGGFNRLLYWYEGGRFDLLGRGWLGFTHTTVLDEQTGAWTTTDFDNVTRLSNPGATTPNRNYRYAGAFRPVQVTTQADARMSGEQSGKIWRVTRKYDYQDNLVPWNYSRCAISKLYQIRTTEEEASVAGPNIGNFTPLMSTRDRYDYDTYGLIISEGHDTFEGGAAPDGAPPPTAKVKNLAINRVPNDPDLANWLVQRFNAMSIGSTEPGRDAINASTDGPATPAVAEQATWRNFNVRWVPGTMTIDHIDVEPNSNDNSLKSTIDLPRDPRGNVKRIDTTADSGIGQTTRTFGFTWDTLDQTLPYQLTNPARQTETLFYHAGLGRLAVIDDVNGLRSTVKFDWFGRTRSIEPASSAGISFDYELTGNNLLMGNLLEITSTLASGGVDKQFIDKWGRVEYTEESRLNGAAMAIVENKYTRLNQLATTTFPHFESSQENPLPVPAYVAFSYDKLGRIRTRSIFDGHPVGQPAAPPESESWTYNGLVSHYTNARGVESLVETDAASRVIREATLAPPPVIHGPLTALPRIGRIEHQVVSRYEYGPFNSLYAATDSAGNRLEMRYDDLGRLIDIKDPSAGYSIITYNGYGEPVYTLDGAGLATTITRDLLGRIKEEDDFDNTKGASSVESLVWDTAAHGIGKLAETTSRDGIKTTYSYDSLSRLSTKEWTIAGEHFTLETDWDPFGRPQYFKYPAVGSPPQQLVLQYHYQQGVLDSVLDQTSQKPYWTLKEQAANGDVFSEQYGTAITTTRTPDTRGRLTSIVTSVQSGAGAPTVIQQLSYTYWPGNLIKRRVNSLNGADVSEDFDYDFLGRLASWKVTQNGQSSGEIYGYDDLGNLTSTTVSAGAGRTFTNKYGPTPTSPNAGPYAVNELDENGSKSVFQYDTAGRQISGSGTSGRIIDWNEHGLPSKIEKLHPGYNPDEIDFQYDGDQKRTVKVGAGATVTYIWGAYERHLSDTKKHVFNLIAPTGVVGQVIWTESNGVIASATTNFFHPDALGTPETVSDGATGTIVDKVEYEPFGQRRDPSNLAQPQWLSSSRSVGFTGQEPDDESQLINMQGRIYDPVSTRFLTPDPVIQNPFFSQSVNSYAYVYNNPVNLTDPTGLQSEDAGVSGSYGDSWDFSGWGGNSDWFGEVQIGFGGSTPGNAPTGQQPGSPGEQSTTKTDATRPAADAGTSWAGSTAFPVLFPLLEPLPSGMLERLGGPSIESDTRSAAQIDIDAAAFNSVYEYSQYLQKKYPGEPEGSRAVMEYLDRRYEGAPFSYVVDNILPCFAGETTFGPQREMVWGAPVDPPPSLAKLWLPEIGYIPAGERGKLDYTYGRATGRQTITGRQHILDRTAEMDATLSKFNLRDSPENRNALANFILQNRPNPLILSYEQITSGDLILPTGTIKIELWWQGSNLATIIIKPINPWREIREPSP